MTQGAPAIVGEIEFAQSESLGAKARHGALWSFAQIVTRHVISLGLTATLARLLMPEHYGLVGMVATLTALLHVFADMGLSWATIQSRTLTQAQVSGLFWVNLAMGVVLWGVMAVAAPVLSAFYQEPALLQIAPVAGISFVVSSIAVQPMALLARAMNFRCIAVIEIVALCSGAGAALILALSGAGVWSLVVQLPVQSAVRAVLSLVASGIQISAPKQTRGLGRMLRFGWMLVLSGIFIFLARTLDSILIGRVWGAEALGFYNRAYFLMLLPSMLASGVLSQLVVSTLSGLQSDPVRFASAYRRALQLVTYVGMPIAVGLALTADTAVLIIYGPGWERVATLLFWLSIAAITQPIYNTNGWLFTATGRSGTYLIVTATNMVILTLVFGVVISLGPIAMAQSYGLVMGLLLPLPVLWIAHRAAGIDLRKSLLGLAPIVTLNVAMGSAVWVIGQWSWGHAPDRISLFAAQITIGVLVYFALTPILLPELVKRDIAPLLRTFGHWGQRT